jgi:hypothetical protein
MLSEVGAEPVIKRYRGGPQPRHCKLTIENRELQIEEDREARRAIARCRVADPQSAILIMQIAMVNLQLAILREQRWLCGHAGPQPTMNSEVVMLSRPSAARPARAAASRRAFHG